MAPSTGSTWTGRRSRWLAGTRLTQVSPTGCGSTRSTPLRWGGDRDCYDVVLAFECVHDLGDPVGVLGAMGRLVAEDGVVMVMDERVGHHFRGPADEVERLFYGFSITSCLPDCRSHHDSAATGTVMRPPVLDAYARRAGFSRLEILDVDHEMFHFYRLHS